MALEDTLPPGWIGAYLDAADANAELREAKDALGYLYSFLYHKATALEAFAPVSEATAEQAYQDLPPRWKWRGRPASSFESVTSATNPDSYPPIWRIDFDEVARSSFHVSCLRRAVESLYRSIDCSIQERNAAAAGRIRWQHSLPGNGVTYYNQLPHRWRC